MSVFLSWCRSAQKQLSNPRVRLSLGQAQEVVAAGLGHRTYASFRVNDLAALGRTGYALIDFDALKRRSAEFGAEATSEACHAAIHGMRFGRNEQGRYVLPHANLGVVASILISEAKQADWDVVAAELGAEIRGVEAGSAAPAEPWNLESSTWLWCSAGALLVSTEEADLSVPVDFEVEFRRLGRHLFEVGKVVSAKRAGGPKEYEHQDVAEYSYFSEDAP